MLSRNERERERSSSKSSPVKSSPYHPRIPEKDRRNNSFQSSKDERRSEDRRSIDHSPHHYAGPEGTSAPTSNSSPRIPSGPRGLNGKPTPAHERSSRVDSRSESEIDQMRPPTMRPVTTKAPEMRSSPQHASQDPNSKEGAGVKDDVVASLGEFTQLVGETTVLSFQKEKAKNNLRGKAGKLRKNQGLETARAELEGVEGKLARKKTDMTKLTESLASRIVSGGIDTGAISQDNQKLDNRLSELEKRMVMHNGELAKATETIVSLSQTIRNDRQFYSEALKAVEGELSKLKGIVSTDQLVRTKLESQTFATSNIASRLDGEFGSLRQELGNTLRSLQEDMDPLRGLPQQVGQIDRDIKLAKDEIRQVKEEKKLNEQDLKRRDSQWEKDHSQLLFHESSQKKFTETQQQHSDRLNKVVTDTVDLRKKLSALEQTTAKSQKADKKASGDELAVLSRRLDTLESNGPQSNLPNRGRSGSARGSTSSGDAQRVEKLFSDVESMKDEFEQLQTNISERFEKFTSDSDDVLCKSIDDMSAQVTNLNSKLPAVETSVEAFAARFSSLEASLELLKQQHSRETQSLGTNMSNFIATSTTQSEQQNKRLQEVQREVQTLKVAPRPSEVPSNFAQSSNVLARQTSSPVVSHVHARQPGSPAVGTPPGGQPEVMFLGNKVEALEMSILHLNSRYNSLTTEALARQMWSQLDHVHPHLKDATKGLPTLELTLQGHEAQLNSLHQKVDSIDRRPTIPPGLKEALEKFDQSVTSLEHRADNFEGKTHSLEGRFDQFLQDRTTRGELTPNLPTRSNGVSRVDGQLSDSNLGKRKAADMNGNGNTKRVKKHMRVVHDSEDEPESNGASDALSPPVVR